MKLTPRVVDIENNTCSVTIREYDQFHSRLGESTVEQNVPGVSGVYAPGKATKEVGKAVPLPVISTWTQTG